MDNDNNNNSPDLDNKRFNNNNNEPEYINKRFNNNNNSPNLDNNRFNNDNNTRDLDNTDWETFDNEYEYTNQTSDEYDPDNEETLNRILARMGVKERVRILITQLINPLYEIETDNLIEEMDQPENVFDNIRLNNLSYVLQPFAYKNEECEHKWVNSDLMKYNISCNLCGLSDNCEHDWDIYENTIYCANCDIIKYDIPYCEHGCIKKEYTEFIHKLCTICNVMTFNVHI